MATLKGFEKNYLEFYFEELKEIEMYLKQRFELYKNSDIILNRRAIKGHIMKAREWEQWLMESSLKDNKNIKIELSEKRFILNGKMWYVV